MDIITGLNAASQALSIAKELRSIDRSVDEATFKLRLADLTEALAEAKISLSEAKLALSEKDEEIHKLRNELAVKSNGESCPVCGVGIMKTLSVSPHPTFGELGVQEKHLKCSSSSCSHEERRIHDPMGLLDS